MKRMSKLSSLVASTSKLVMTFGFPTSISVVKVLSDSKKEELESEEDDDKDFDLFN